MKGAFAGGVLTTLNTQLPAQNFQLIVAVSSGACSAAYYASTKQPQPERGELLLNIWRWELAGKRLIWIFNPLKRRSLLDQKFLVDHLFAEKYPMERENFGDKDLPEFRIAATNLKTLSVEYVKATSENIFDLLKAATSLPIATKGRHMVDGTLYSDAAILNPLPINDLIESGYKDITVIMNSPLDQVSAPLRAFTRFLAFPVNRKISRLMKELHHFHFNHNRNLASLPPEGVRIRIIAPESELPVGLVTTKQELLSATVELGKQKGWEFIQKFGSEFLQKKEKRPAKKSLSGSKNSAPISKKSGLGLKKKKKASLKS